MSGYTRSAPTSSSSSGRSSGATSSSVVSTHALMEPKSLDIHDRFHAVPQQLQVERAQRRMLITHTIESWGVLGNLWVVIQYTRLHPVAQVERRMLITRAIASWGVLGNLWVVFQLQANAMLTIHTIND